MTSVPLSATNPLSLTSTIQAYLELVGQSGVQRIFQDEASMIVAFSRKAELGLGSPRDANSGFPVACVTTVAASRWSSRNQSDLIGIPTRDSGYPTGSTTRGPLTTDLRSRRYRGVEAALVRWLAGLLVRENVVNSIAAKHIHREMDDQVPRIECGPIET